MTRLENHRKLLESEKRNGPLLRIEDLNPEEITIINASFLEMCKSRRVEDINQTYIAYADTLHKWGVMCPHPQQLRLYDGQSSDVPIDFQTFKWFECKLCSAEVINKEM